MSTSDSKGVKHSIIDIKTMLKQISKDKEHSSAVCVCVCSVPKLFSSAKPQSFTPRLVGLGPYHHSKPNLTMTDESKVSVAKRILQDDSIDGFVPEVKDDHLSLIQGCYPSHEAFWFTYDPSEVLYILTIDGLFLLALLLHHGAQYSSSIYILTGEDFGMTLVNTAGEELTMDGVVSDIFMLENQIPTLVLHHIIEVNFQNRFPVELEHLGSLMLYFCKIYSPLAHSDSANNHQIPQPNHHLLDLMYHLIVPEPQSEAEPEPEANRFLYYSTLGVTCLCLLVWIILWVLVYCVVLIVQPFLLFIPSVLVKVIPWLGVILDKKEVKSQTLPYFLSALLDWSLYHAFPIKFTPISRIVGEAVNKTHRFLKLRETKNSLEAMVPSVTQLHSAKIQFKPVEGDIYSIKFDEIRRELYLPRMKLDATSEVILKNLAVYESLIKTKSLNFPSNESLSFSSYIEFVRDLIQTPEDVRILADENIIQSELSAIGIAHIFKEPIDKSSGRPTKQIQTLQEQLKKVKPKFDAMKNVDLIFNAFLRICVISGVVVLFSPLLVQAFNDILCSTILGDMSQSCKRRQVGDYSRNDYFVSS